MGMYTGLRGTIVLKSEYTDRIEAALEEDGYFEWKDILPETNLYSDYSRNSFIPFGSVCYMPDDWYDQQGVELKEGVLHFCCSLKNYSGTISTFIKECLPEIANSWELEELYEEDNESTLYTFPIE
jgi:hypothetical protein